VRLYVQNVQKTTRINYPFVLEKNVILEYKQLIPHTCENTFAVCSFELIRERGTWKKLSLNFVLAIRN